MQRHHTAALETNDYSLPVNQDLTVKVTPRTTQLWSGGAQLVSIGASLGKPTDAEPKLNTAVCVESFEHMRGARPEHLALALYAALRSGRINQRTAVVSGNGVLPSAVGDLIKIKPLRGSNMATRLDTALIDLSRAFEESLVVDPGFYTREVSDTVNVHVKKAFERGFFAAVGRGEVSREQYVYVMSQQHAYVKYTTRILGYCVAYSQDSNLRKHFAKHLSEEINHEKIIEADLQHLGADVAYVINDLEPNVSTLQFTLGELALVSHFHDSILLTAAPLAAEGLTAHLDRTFIESLNKIVASWGVDSPEKATRFLASHIDFDSGYDGHFEGSMRLLGEHLPGERQLRRFISALHAQMNSFLRIYEDGMEESALWV